MAFSVLKKGHQKGSSVVTFKNIFVLRTQWFYCTHVRLHIFNVYAKTDSLNRVIQKVLVYQTECKKLLSN